MLGRRFNAFFFGGVSLIESLSSGESIEGPLVSPNSTNTLRQLVSCPIRPFGGPPVPLRRFALGSPGLGTTTTFLRPPLLRRFGLIFHSSFTFQLQLFLKNLIVLNET